MALTPCDPCGCIPGNEQVQVWQQNMRFSLCAILAAIEAGGLAADVNVLSDIPGTGATNLGKAEDAPSASGDTGVSALAVYRSTPVQSAGTVGDYSNILTDALGALFVRTSLPGAPVTTQPSVTNATSFTLLAANPLRKYFFIQNNSGSSILLSISGDVLTGIVPTSTNKGIVVVAGGAYESPNSYISTSAITVYQTSGGTINTITVVEG